MNWKFEFTGAYTSINKLPTALEYGEIPIFGRSNVGKSSFINSIAKIKHLAKTSSTPGKTRTINFYKVNNLFYFVDLPGYGYAKISASERKKWGKMVMNYLSGRPSIKFYIILIDIRHELHETDIKSLELTNYFNVPSFVVLTKKDKLNRSTFNKQLDYFDSVLKNYNVFGIIPFSSLTGEGRTEVMTVIERRLGLKGE
jgi:GTP-binding protein